MARQTSFAAATLTITLTEDITIDSRDYGSSQTVEIASIVDITRRIVTITTTETTIATFSAAVGAGGYIAGNVMYIRFTNLDDTNFVTLTFRNQDNDEVAIKVDRGKSLLLMASDEGMAAMFNATEDADADSHANVGSLTNIQAHAQGGSVDIEMYIACK